MMQTTPRFALPFLIPGQAQKELFHNEAISAIDGLLHLCIETATLTAPPAAPSLGQSWIVAAGAAGAWAGHESALATWTDGGWRFVAPRPGMSAWNLGTGRWATYAAGHWTDGVISGTAVLVDGDQVVGARQPTIPSPSGGTIIDAEARACIDAVIATLMSHGLID